MKNWEAPITIARHAYGDMYKAVDMVTEEPAPPPSLQGRERAEKTLTVQTVSGPAVWQWPAQHGEEHPCLCPQLLPVRHQSAAGLVVLHQGHHLQGLRRRVQTIFEEEYETTYKAEFEKLGLSYFYTLIDDAVARVIRSRGGFIWALKNYDGDVMSDMVATAFGSLAMMTSVLVSPDGTMSSRRPTALSPGTTTST